MRNFSFKLSGKEAQILVDGVEIGDKFNAFNIIINARNGRNFLLQHFSSIKESILKVIPDLYEVENESLVKAYEAALFEAGKITDY